MGNSQKMSGLPYSVPGMECANDVDMSGGQGWLPPLPANSQLDAGWNADMSDPLYPAVSMHVYVTILGARGLRDRWPVVHCNPFCICRGENSAYPEFETHVVHNNGTPMWNREQEISNDAIGGALEFAVVSKATPG